MKNKIKKYITKWEKQGYENGIPDTAPSRLELMGKVPSYRMICRAIMRNDLALTTLGYSKPKSHYYNLLKKIEIESR